VENWRHEYNNYRPHSSLDYLTPVEFALKILRNQAGRRGWTIKAKGRDSLIIGGTKIGGISTTQAYVTPTLNLCDYVISNIAFSY
jgi:hypothetical protein